MTKEPEMIDNQEEILDFEEATQLTIKDALDKESELQAGITDQDSVLDKYIKQHRDEVGEQKFLNKVGDLDTEALDDFIQKQRAELAERKAELLAGAAMGTVAATAAASKLAQETDVKAEESLDSPVPTEPVEPVPAPVETTSSTSFDDLVAKDRLLDDSSVLEDKPKKNKFLIAGALGAIFLSVAAAGYGLNYLNKSVNQTNTTTTETSSAPSSSATTESSTKEDSAELKAFDELYKSFFADEELTKPKNSEFDKLSDLEEALKALEGTDDYEEAKSKVDSLSKTIAAIQAINDKFESPAILDGEKVEATLKEDASFDDLSSEVLNTGKASLDTLIQAVVAEGRGLLGTGGGTISGASAAASTATETVSQSTDNTGGQAATATDATVAQPETPAVTQPVAEVVVPVQETVVAAPAAGTQVVYGGQVGQTVAVRTDLPAGHIQAPTNYGLINYDPSTLQRELSRVPFNFDLIADATNPAWTFNPGVMEEIIRVSQQRGYINGYEFILEPVNIVNGNGYYNMYKPDGTYLFTINAKTGYFVGNGRGYAEALDY